MMTLRKANPATLPSATLPALLACVFAVAASGARANTAAATLQTIEVKGQTLGEGGAAYTASGFASEEIRAKSINQVQQLFRHVPGMDIRVLGLTGVADSIVLRGFGGGGHGGDIAVSVDGIPLNEAMSHADGYVDLNVIVPLELRTMTVLKGPVSALYGNFNRAGSISLETRKGGEYRELDLSAGSFGTVDAQTALGVKVSDTQHLNLAAQLYRSDGFRAQSESWRATLAGRWSVDLTGGLRAALSARIHTAQADNPGYLSAARFRADPYGKEPGVQNDGTEKDFATLRTDVQYALSDQLTLLGFAYATRQDFTRWFTRPLGGVPTQREESYDRKVHGAGVNLNGRHNATVPLNWVAGVETFRESTDYVYYDNLDFRRRVTPAINDRNSVLRSLSAFGELEAPLHPLFKPTLGVRWDRFTGNCSPNGPETSTAPCERMPRMSHTAPKFGLRSQIASGLELRASRAEGFALPSDFAKYALGASVLDPNIFRQTEVGARLTAVPGLMIDAAAYRLQSSDEVRAVAPGVYENFGSTRRTGYELEILWMPHDDVDLTLAWGEADSKITRNANPALVGKRVTGVPRHTLTAELTWRPLPGWQSTLTWREIGRYQVDAANTRSDQGYGIADLRLSYSAGSLHPYTVYAAIDNLADRRYATAVNTIGYASGAPRTVRVGVQVNF